MSSIRSQQAGTGTSAGAARFPAGDETGFDAAVESWIRQVEARHATALSVRERHRGVRALSSLYVERRAHGPIAARAIEGAAKRAAFAGYYAPLHALAARAALAALGTSWLAGVRRVVDLGAGTGAVGAALAGALPGPPRLLAVDRSGWALAEARRTFGAFGLRGSTRRGQLPAALPRLAADDAVLLGWAANELESEARDSLLARLDEALERGTRLLLLEPLAGGVAPWLPAWAESLAPRGVALRELRARVALPDPLAAIDRATGLRHDELGMRVLFGPVPGAGT